MYICVKGVQSIGNKFFLQSCLFSVRFVYGRKVKRRRAGEMEEREDIRIFAVFWRVVEVWGCICFFWSFGGRSSVDVRLQMEVVGWWRYRGGCGGQDSFVEDMDIYFICFLDFRVGYYFLQWYWRWYIVRDGFFWVLRLSGKLIREVCRCCRDCWLGRRLVLLFVGFLGISILIFFFYCQGQSE